MIMHAWVITIQMQILKDCNISIVNVYRQVLGIAKSRVSNHVDLNLYYTSVKNCH